MRRVAFRLKIKADRLDEYRARHRQVWPDMLAALRETGLAQLLALSGRRRNTLRLPGDGRLQAGPGRNGDTRVNERWQTAMAPFFEQLDGGHADQGMLRLEEVFHLD